MAVVDTSPGFKFEFCLFGGPPLKKTFYTKDTENLTKGDLLNLESGEVDLAATDDSTLLGVALESVVGVDSTTLIECIISPDAVYSVYDANARNAGATLDISGLTGAQTVAASSNADLMVVAPSSADERTLVMIKWGEHAFN